MSGICGIFWKDSRPAEALTIGKMLSSLAHRGLDGIGVWTEGPIGLGHCLRMTTPESLAEVQPVSDRIGRLTLVCDGRIDNRMELIRVLNLEVDSAARMSDAEMALSAFERWGESFAEKLLGDFSVAVWDEREGCLVCARDPIGVKPFYYLETPYAFLFASEIKALLTFADTPLDLNPERIADYLAGTFEDKTSTFYRDIRRLAPGHTLEVGQKHSKVRCYWTLDPEHELEPRSDEDYEGEFREIFTSAVACRTRSAFPTGFLLSGGLDSSCIVSVARHLNSQNGNHPLNGFSATFPGFPSTDETAFIDELLKGGGIDLHPVRIAPASPFEGFDRALETQDEPFQTPNWFVYNSLAEAAKRKGSRILLDGVDGDTTVSHGFEYLTELFVGGRWGRFAQEVSWLSQRFGHRRSKFLWHYGCLPTLERIRWGFSSRLPGGIATPFKAPAFVRPEFVRAIGWEDRYWSLLGDRAKPAQSLREEHWRSLTSGILPFYLEVIDKASASLGMDHRHPFFDRRLVEFCLALPSQQKLNQGWDRAIQRRAMVPFLPEKTAQRLSKSIWRRMFEESLLSRGGNMIEDRVLKDPGPLAAYVDSKCLRQLYRRCVERRRSEDVVSLWVVSSLGLWLRSKI